MDRPTSGGYPAALPHLSAEEKRALLADLLRRKAESKARTIPRSNSDDLLAAATLCPAPRDGPLPLSLGQETLWFLDQLEPGNTTYNCPAVVRMTGPLNPETVRRSFETIIHRHE